MGFTKIQAPLVESQRLFSRKTVHPSNRRAASAGACPQAWGKKERKREKKKTKRAEATVQFVPAVSGWMVAAAGWNARPATAHVYGFGTVNPQPQAQMIAYNRREGSQEFRWVSLVSRFT